MFVLNPADRLFCGTILLEPTTSRARALGYLNASSGENCIAALSGFRGAVMFVSDADNKLIELVVWDSPEAFQAVQGDYRYFDHIPVVGEHATNGHICVSYDMFAAGPTTFKRGDRWRIAMATVADHDPADVVQALQAQAADAPDTIFQTGDTAAGRVVVTIGRSPRPPVSSFLSGAVERWRYDVEAIEASTATSTSKPRGIPHRMSRLASRTEAVHA